MRLALSLFSSGAQMNMSFRRQAGMASLWAAGLGLSAVSVSVGVSGVLHWMGVLAPFVLR
jgi:hypothetical protein